MTEKYAGTDFGSGKDMTKTLFVIGKKMADTKCPYCGKTLHQIVHTGGGVVIYAPRIEDCDCVEAKAQREREAAEKAKEDKAREASRHRATVDKLLRSSGIRGRYLEKTLENYRPGEGNGQAFKLALKYVQKFAEMRKAGQGLYFCGGCGIGKTHLATGIAQALIEQEYRVICQPSVNLLADIKATYDMTGECSEYDLLRAYLRADLLVIDDLGKEAITDWSLSMLYTIINMRYEDRRPIVITTNYDDTQLIDRMARKGDRVTAESIVSRLHEISYAVPMAGPDHRGARES